MKKRMISKVASAVLVAGTMTLVGCGSGGGGGGSPTAAASTSGGAVDGYILGATVFADENNNSILDGVDLNATTNKTNGDFTLSGTIADGTKIYVYGGIDKSTGYPFEGRLALVYKNGQKPIVSPVSTYVAALVDRNMTLSAAQALAAANLGINVADIGKDPMTDSALFLASQKIQKVAEVLATTTGDTDFNKAYTDVFASLATITDNNTTGGDFNATKLATKVATDKNITIAPAVTTFLDTYTKKVDDFTSAGLDVDHLDSVGEMLNTYTTIAQSAIDQNNTSALATLNSNLADLNVSETRTNINDGNYTNPLTVALNQVEDALDNNVSYLGTNTADNNITTNLVLTSPTAAPFDTPDLNLTWSSSNATVLSDSGVITPAYADTPVVLKATVNNALVSNFRNYNLVIKRMEVAPTASDLNVTTNEDIPKLVNLSGAIGDLNGDTPVITAVGSATNGTAALIDGNVTYTPNLNFNGSDSFTYTVTDDTGRTAQGRVNVTVTPVNDPTVWHTNANLGTKLEDFGSMTVDLNATDVDGNVTYTLGSYTAGITPTLSGSTLTIDSVLNASGAQNVVVTASQGGVDTNQTFTLNVLPVDDAAVWQSVPTLSAVSEDFTTPVTVDLNATDVDSPVVYTIESNNGIVNAIINGSTLTLSAISNANGVATVVVAANGVPQTINLTVNAVNDAPVVPSNNLTLSVITSGTLTGQLNATDVDGDTLTYSNASVGGAGTITLNPDGTFTYKAGASRGAVTFTYDVSDGTATVQGTQTINVVASNPPSANPDTATVVENSDVTIDVLGNDSDDVTANADLNITATTAPTNGSIVVNSDKTITYTPNSGYIGSDSFTYTIADSDGSAATATVTVTVTALNNAPVLNNAELTILHNETIVLPLHATDDDNDTLTYSLDSTSNLSRFTDANITSSGVLSFKGGAIGQGSIVVDVNDSKTVTQATYTVSVIGPQKHYDGYSPSEGGSVPASTYDNYSAVAVPKDVTQYSLYGARTENNVTSFDVTYAKFDSNGTFEMFDEDGLHNWAYTENTTTHEITISDGSGADVAAFKQRAIENTPSSIASDLNLSMPAGAAVYKVAFKMLQESYDFWDEAKDWSNNGVRYTSLQAFVDNKIAEQSRTNYQRALVFAPDTNISAGSGTLAEADLTVYNYSNHTTPPVILNANAGTWKIVRSPMVDNNNSDVLLITPNDTSKYQSRIYVLDTYGVQGNATNTVWEGEYDPVGTVWLETDFNEKALAVVKNVAKVVTPLAYVQNLNINSEINASEFANLSQVTNPSGLTFNSLHIDMNATDYSYRRLELAFTVDGHVTATNYVNGVEDAVYADNAAYTYNADQNITLGTTVLKIGPDMNTSTLYNLSGLSFDSSAKGYMVGHDDNETSFDKGIYFNPEATAIVKANFENFENRLNYSYTMIDNRTLYMVMANGTQSVITFVNDNGVRTMYETDNNHFSQSENPQEFSYVINADGDIELLDQGNTIATIAMDSNTGATENVTITDGNNNVGTATIYLNENDANNP